MVSRKLGTYQSLVSQKVDTKTCPMDQTDLAGDPQKPGITFIARFNGIPKRYSP